MNNNFERQSFIPSNDDYQETLQEEHLAGGDGTTSPSSQRWFSNSNLLRRGSSGASFQERSLATNRNQNSIQKHRSFGAAQTVRAQQQSSSSSNNSGWSSFDYSSASQPINSSLPSAQVDSMSSYQSQNLSQGGASTSQVFVDSLSYEDLTAMLNSSWEQPTTFPGETAGASGSGTTIDDALDFNSLPRTNRRTPPPVMENPSDLISPSRVIRNPRDLTSPRPSSAHDPFADSTYSRLDFQDQNRDGGLSGHRSPDFDQSSNFQADVFGESALSSSWAGPSLSGTRGGGQWGSFRDRSFSTSHSEADMDWDADLSLEDNRSASPAISLSPSSITGVLIPGGSDSMHSFSPNDLISTPSRLHRLPEEESTSVAGSSSQDHSQSFRSPSSLSMRSNRGVGGSSVSGFNRPLSPSQQLQIASSSMDLPGARRRGAISPTNVASSQSIQQRRRANARSTGTLRSGPGPIRPSTAGGHSTSLGGSGSALSGALRNRAGTASQIYMSPNSGAVSSNSPYAQEARIASSSSSLDEATSFSGRRPSSRASLRDGLQDQIMDRPRSQIQVAYDAYSQLPGEGGLPASLSSELANVSLGFDSSQLGDEAGDISMMLAANSSGPSSVPMSQGDRSSSGSGGARSGQQNAGETSLGWEDNSFVSTSNTSSLGVTAQDDSLLSSRIGSNSFGPRGTDTPLSSPASSPFHSRQASFASMHPSARDVANLGEVSEFGELEMIDSLSDRSSTWPRVRPSGSTHGNSLQTPPIYQSRSSSAVQTLSSSSSTTSRQQQKEMQRRLSQANASIDMDSSQRSIGSHPRRSSTSLAVESYDSRSESNSSRWSMVDAAPSATRNNQGRAVSNNRDAARINNSSSSSSTNDYRSPVHEVLASPNAAQVIEEVARRERNSRVKYNEVSAALDTLRLFLKQREDSLGIGPIPGISSSSSSSSSSGGVALRSAPSNGNISIASSAASVGNSSSSRTTPARTLRHPPRGPLPPRGSISSSSSSSHTQTGNSTSRFVDDISERVTRMRQRSEQFSQQNLREAYRTASSSSSSQQPQHNQLYQGQQ